MKFPSTWTCLLLSVLPIYIAVILGSTAVSAQAPKLDNAGRTGPSPEDIESREWLMSPPAEDESQTWPRYGLRRRTRPFIAFENGKIGGSPGCGIFTGTYRRSGDLLTLSVQWADDEKSPCSSDDRKDVAQILRSFAKVRKIHAEPEYWNDDALLLNDGKGITEIDLSPMHTGKDLAEVQDTFWQLTKLEGTGMDFSGVVINIEESAITFSLPAYSISFPYEYKLSGLEFFPAWKREGVIGGVNSAQKQKAVKAFEIALHKIASYELTQGNLAFLDHDRQPIILLSSLLQTGIENRRWRIAEYPDGSAIQVNKDGLTPAKERAEITFLNGNVEGSPGCGGWVGSYKLSGNQLTVQASVVLAGLCYPRETAQSDLVVKAFKGDLRIEQSEGRILLRDKDGDARILLLPF